MTKLLYLDQNAWVALARGAWDKVAFPKEHAALAKEQKDLKKLLGSDTLKAEKLTDEIKAIDAKFGELLGAHLIGSQATELIAELVMAKKLEATEEEILSAMHPHPTYSEAVMEAAAQGLGQSVHL